MKDTVERFSDRVANYVKWRPGYPPEVLDVFREKMGLDGESVIADLGSGTGLSAKLFLEHGNVVFGVEPNAAMREAAEEFLAGYARFASVNGTAQATTLDESSVNFVIAAQAFHWFDRAAAAEECRRILKQGGYVALIWNERELTTTPFLIGYEKLLTKFGTDYESVRHENIDSASLADFFGKVPEHASARNVQAFDLDGITGRLLSSSYTPAVGHPSFEPMLEELGSLFAKHAENGRIKVFYTTNIFYSRL
ncbi:MAG: class I SAM-dependent methyltransferase [Blastocatellia bacterium]|nr:class I SAM-dependent methyltransferase [Blastocatellia bacterium]